ncbi:MAG TPA: hypothetical protein VEW08_02130 [Steroidobacteraceae bacterium]|nr:hypothetical protein [Steroidobacteraceae bacterium]
MTTDEKKLVPGVILLRIALIAGLYVIVYLVASFIPTPPGISSEMRDFISTLFAVAMWIGAIAPIVAIIGVVLLRVSRHRFKALDWVSLAVGISTVLLPALFVWAYSNCPNGIC